VHDAERRRIDLRAVRASPDSAIAA